MEEGCFWMNQFAIQPAKDSFPKDPARDPADGFRICGGQFPKDFESDLSFC
jgi:hypothetical protein